MNLLLSSTLLFLVIMDPLGNLPIFISFLKHSKESRQKFIIMREMLIALFTILLFLFFGEKFLSILKINNETISISGGIILFIISLKMIFEELHPKKNESEKDEPFIVPLAIPLIAGPSLLSTLILLNNTYKENIWLIFLSILLSWTITTIILLFSSFILKKIGEKGINAIEKLMGLILLMLSVQMFLEGMSIWIKNNIF